MLELCANVQWADLRDICLADFYIGLISAIVITVSCICWCFLLRTKPCDIKKLLRFHNLRSVLLILLFFANLCDIGLSSLKATHVQVSPFLLQSVCLCFISAISVAASVRIVETRKSKLAIRWLCVVQLLEVVQFMAKLWKFVYLQTYLELNNPYLLIQMVTTCLLFGLSAVDAVTIYLEKSTSITSKSCDPTLLSKENISYKNPYSSFLSKTTFWWMTGLFWKGFFKPLELTDLGNLHEKDTSRYQYDQFLFIYQSCKNKQVSLWTCYAKSCCKMFLVGGLFKLFGDLCGLVGPLSISYIVDFINVQISNSSVANTTDYQYYGHYEPQNYSASKYEELFQSNWDEFISNGWILSTIVLFAFLLQGTLSQSSTYLVNMEGIKIKNALQGLIYRKTLSLSCSCFYSNSEVPEEEQEHRCDAGTITNLMSDDALNVMSFFWIAHYIWSIPLKIGIVLYCLYLKLGISSLIGSLICIVTMVPLQFAVGKMMSSNSKRGAKCADERLKKINEIFQGIKIIKLNAWEKIFQDKISDCRKNELNYLNLDAVYWTLMTFLTHVSTVLITVTTFAIYSFINDDGVEFTAGNVFTTLALFNQLTVPLFIFPITIPIIISASISTKRIHSFLSQKEIEKEFEGIRNMARVLCKSDASLDLFEDKNKFYGKYSDDAAGVESTELMNEMKTQDAEISENQLETVGDVTLRSHPKVERLKYPELTAVVPQIALNVPLNNCIDKLNKKAGVNEMEDGKMPNNSQHKIKLRKQNQLNESTKFLRCRSKSISDGHKVEQKPKAKPFTISDELVVCIKDGLFAWSVEDKSQLQIGNLSISKGVLTVVVGQSGSGKSSLVGALLKEMIKVEGEVYWNKYSTVAFASQTPFLLNTTIKENILFGESFRPKRYERVIESCSLRPDLDLMPEGDLTQIGERGLNLSGGQRQRISIARALYSSANVVILDDPFASLDNEVGSSLFEKSIRKILLKYKRTTILVTQKTQLVYNADYIVAMVDSKIRVAGTMKEIMEWEPLIVKEWDELIAKENAQESQLGIGKTAKERWKLFKNITRIGLQRSFAEEGHLSSLTSLFNAPLKRNSSLFGSKHFTHDLPLPIDECFDENIDFQKLPELRINKQKKDILRVNSLQVNATHRLKSPVIRHISSPTSLNYVHKQNRTSDGSYSSFGRRLSFRQFLRRMSSKRRKPTLTRASMEKSGPYREKRKSIGSITEDYEPQQGLKRASAASKLSEEFQDDENSIDLEEEQSIRYAEERKYGKIPTNVYVAYLKSCGLSTIGIFFGSTLLWQLFRVYTDVWLRDWTESSDASDVKYYFNIYAMLSGFCILSALVSSMSGQLAGSFARKVLHEQLIDSLMKNNLNFFSSTPFGRIMNRFSFDVAIIDKKIATTIQRLLQFVLLCLCSILINIIISYWFLLLTIPIFGVYWVVQKFYRSSCRELQRIESITSSPVISHFSETIAGLSTIRAYNQESRFMETLFKRMEDNNVAFVILNSSNRWLGIALDYLGAFIVFCAILMALISSKIMPQSVQSSLVGLAINYTLLIPIYLNWVVKLFADLEMYFGAVERIRYYIDSETHRESVERIEYCKPVPISWPQHGNIVFENVSLKHENQTENVITNLNLNIPTGQRIIICGRSGSGKSTLAMSLFGVVGITDGRILIDNVDISTIHLDELRSRLSVIPQDVILFSGTVRDNLDPIKHFSDLELWNSLEIAQLKDTISLLPNKLDTYLTEGDSMFSSGQRQLFCLARAVLRGSICLVLDEFTSSLDSHTERKLFIAANEAFKGRTIITIAHRLFSLLDYDRVLILENGKIIEDGNPVELKANQSSIFTAMLNAADLTARNK